MGDRGRHWGHLGANHSSVWVAAASPQEALQGSSAGRGLLHIKGELKEEVLGFPVPPSPKLALGLVSLPTQHGEDDGLIGLGDHEQVLPAPVREIAPPLIGSGGEA